LRENFFVQKRINPFFKDVRVFGANCRNQASRSGSATSTSNVGFNITNGCYAIGGNCLNLSGTFPFTTQAGYNSTTTTLGLLNGIFSTASSTFSGPLNLSSLGQGFAYTGSNGLVGTISTSTLASQIFTAQTFAPNSIVTTNASGNLIATGTQLTVGNLIATTTATSLFGGQVGIGTTTPAATAKLDVAGYVYSEGIFSGFRMGTTSNGSTGQFVTDSNGTYLDYNMNLQIRNGNGFSEKLRIDSSGKIGVATTTPNYLLTLLSNTAPQFALSEGAGTGQKNSRAIRFLCRCRRRVKLFCRKTTKYSKKRSS
jgi:hypothetical protein